MKILRTINEVREQINIWKMEDCSIGLVPTMGYLHEGHKSLITKAVSENDKVIVSIFVNPIQFGPNEDLDTYPRDLNHDSILCDKAGVDIIFNPDSNEMYPNKVPLTHVIVNDITSRLCGATRPSHFQGVCTVVSKLFNITQANRAYFGQKDAQQLCVIKTMVSDLNFPIEIVSCPIVRENDGLAKSSRNIYLNQSQRKAALVLSESLQKAKKTIENGEKNCQILKTIIKNHIIQEPLAKIDYVEIVDFINLKPVDTIKPNTLIAMAVYIGKTRLIDNIIL